MKKNIKILVTFIALIFCFSLKAKAQVIGTNYKVWGSYNVYEQKFGGLEAFCIDAGLKNISDGDLKQCTVSELNVSSSAANILNNSSLTYAQKQYLLRVLAINNGLQKSSSSTMNNIKNGVYESATGINSSLLNVIKNERVGLSQGALTFQVESSNCAGTTCSATIRVTSNSINVNLLSYEFNGKVISISNGILNISGIKEECVGLTGTIYAYSNANIGTSDSNSVNTSGTTKYYYYNCLGYQNYIIPVPNGIKIPGIGDGNNSSGSSKKNIVATYELNIPDPDCVCSGESVIGDCNEAKKPHSKDVTDNINCIISGRYQSYCGDTIEKTVDDGKWNEKEKGYEINLNNNPYCKVYCTEDIEYDIPGTIDVKNGSYFALKDDGGNKLSVKGTRTCYTSKINKEKFKKEVKNLQEKIKDEINTAREKWALAEALEKAPITDGNIYKDSCTVQNCTTTNGKTSCSNVNHSGNASYTAKRIVAQNVTYSMLDVTYGNMNNVESTNTRRATTTTDELNEAYATTSCPGGCNGGIKYNSTPDKTIENIKEEKIAEYEKAAQNAEDNAKAKIKELKKKIDNYKSCFEWHNNYQCFEPKVEFSYDEVYDAGGELERKELTPGTPSVSLGNSISAYNEISGGSYNPQEYTYMGVGANSLDNSGTKDVKYGDGIKKIDDFNTYVSKTETKTATFNTAVKKAYTYHPYGTIEFDYKGNDSNYVMLGKEDDGYVFPVALEHANTGGVYKYYLKFKDIGVSGNDDNQNTCKRGRISTPGCGLNDIENQNRIPSKEDYQYVCYYTTKKIPNCPECEIECVCPDNDPDCYVEDGICKWNKDKCPECVVDCVGCIWNDGDSTFAYKQVSVSDVFPNNKTTEVGANWNTNSAVNKQADKAEFTINEIEEDSQTVYKTPEYSYTLTPQTMSKIRRYNKMSNEDNNQNIPTGGYNNDTLECKSDNKNGYYCTSTFLKWLNENSSAENKRNDKWTPYSDGSAWK